MNLFKALHPGELAEEMSIENEKADSVVDASISKL